MDCLFRPQLARTVDGLVVSTYLSEKLDRASAHLNAAIFSHLVVKGPATSGKLSFVELLKRRHAAPDFIVVTLDESFDSKNLVGAYVCDETGSFVFKKGPLTVAAEQGIWLILRGIERAPPDLLTFLLPLVEENKLEVSTRMQITPKLGFRLIAL
jgi:midasin (ATPase involved in ribosome maturation)